jgi:hypothetical protein
MMLMTRNVFLPSTGSIINFILLRVTHHNNFRIQRFLPLFYKHGQLVAEPVHLNK